MAKKKRKNVKLRGPEQGPTENGIGTHVGVAGSEHGKVLSGALKRFFQNAESRQGKHITELSASRALIVQLSSMDHAAASARSLSIFFLSLVRSETVKQQHGRQLLRLLAERLRGRDVRRRGVAIAAIIVADLRRRAGADADAAALAEGACLAAA